MLGPPPFAANTASPAEHTASWHDRASAGEPAPLWVKPALWAPGVVRHNPLENTGEAGASSVARVMTPPLDEPTIPFVQTDRAEAATPVMQMSRERISLIVIQRQLGHADLAITSRYLRGIDNTEIIQAVHQRPEPIIPAGRQLLSRD